MPAWAYLVDPVRFTTLMCNLANVLAVVIAATHYHYKHSS